MGEGGCKLELLRVNNNEIYPNRCSFSFRFFSEPGRDNYQKSIGVLSYILCDYDIEKDDFIVMFDTSFSYFLNEFENQFEIFDAVRAFIVDRTKELYKRYRLRLLTNTIPGDVCEKFDMTKLIKGLVE